MPVRPINPFIGGPVPPSKFIGRREQVNTILSQLANPESRGSSAISGEHRIGKTSLMHYIASPEAAKKYGLPPDRFVFVTVEGHALDSYVNNLGLQTLTEDAFWQYVMQFIVHSMKRASPLPQFVSRIPGFERLAKALGRSMWRLRQDKTGTSDPFELSEQIAADGKLAILLLDEFEWIINNTNPQRPILLNTLRSLINLPIAKRGFAFITSSEEPLSVLCKDIKFTGSPFPNSLIPVHLKPFSPDEAHELIDEYPKTTAVAFSDADKDFAYDLSKGHPYWLQRVCFAMFNRYLEKAEGSSVQGTQITMVLDALDREEIMAEIMVERGRTSMLSIREREGEGEEEAQPSPENDLPPTPRKFKILVSSTSLDLQRERQAVEEALHRMRTASFSGMEYFGSRPETPKEVCLEEVSRSDVYIGIFAHRYGYIDPESGLSMTELEYRKARECNIPCLIYMMDESVPVLPAHIEQEPEAVAKLKALRQDLLSKHVVSFFTNPDNLAMQFVADLNNLFKERGVEMEKRTISPKKGEPAMTSPIDLLALTVLTQATQFLFDELGRRLDFWRKQKGEEAIPKSVEPVSRPDGVIVKLDDLERQVDMQRLLSKKEDIETSMHIILEKKRLVGELRKQAASALTPPAEQAKIKAGIRGIEDEITLESNKLEALLKQVYGESSE